MFRRLTNRFRRLVSATLAVGLWVCCCQTHVIAVTGSHDDASGPAGVESCCDRTCPTEPDAPGDDRSAPKGCNNCCIKGSGLKDGTGLDLPVADLLATIALPSIVVHATAPTPPALVDTVDTTRLRVEPTTLLRLRCALLV